MRSLSIVAALFWSSLTLVAANAGPHVRLPLPGKNLYSTASKTIASISPLKAVTKPSSPLFLKPFKVAVVAWCVSEVLYVNGLLDLVNAKVKNVLYHINQWWKETRKDRRMISKAWRTKVHPIYRWAIGAATGMILTPVGMSVELMVVFWTVTGFVLNQAFGAILEAAVEPQIMLELMEQDSSPQFTRGLVFGLVFGLFAAA